jgi:gentisate 1,2-dioxygenase
VNLEGLNQFLEERGLHGSWQSRAKPKQSARFAALHWRWADIYEALLRSGELVPVGPSGLTEMRSVRGMDAAGLAIDMNAQILMPGERTRAHRNMRNETRLVWEAPPEAVFVCNNEAFAMERGDLIVSPTWSDHDHVNAGESPAIWVDGYDTGYARLGAEINVRFPEDSPYQEVLDAQRAPERGCRPAVRYPWTETVSRLAAAECNPFDGYRIMFPSPVDGGPTLPTIAWHAQRLPAGMSTRAHRHNSTTCCHVFEGRGATEIEGERIEWADGDLFAIPPWSWHRYEASTDALLFSIDDWPAMTKLGFYRQEEAP